MTRPATDGGVSLRRRTKGKGRSGATIYEVAEKAGVSISTVSLALNNPDRVAEKTLDRVLTAVGELGFVPKAEASLRARKGTGRVGVVAPFTSYPSFMERLRGVMAAASEGGYEIVVYDDESTALRHHLVDSLPFSRRLDGLILMSVPMSDRFAGRLAEDGLGAVLVEFARPEFSSVVVDDEAGGRMAAEHLLGRGHERLAYIGEAFVGEQPEEELVAIGQAERRLRGFRRGIEEAGLNLPARYVVMTPHGVENGRRAARRLLKLDEPPTAIFAHSDVLAVGVLKAAKDLALSVPEDVAVVGFDDCDFADYVGLTTVRQPLFESGRIAMRLMRERMSEGEGAVAQTVALPLSVVARATT
jgi:LacI family transcriptional regulator